MSGAMTSDSSDLFGALFETPALQRAVPVLVPLPVPGAYSYAVPEGMHVEPGSVVQVPLGPRQVIGVVWEGGDDGKVDPKKLRPITHVFECPPLDATMRAFISWIAAYTLTPPGLVARMALRAPAESRAPRSRALGVKLPVSPKRSAPAGSRTARGHGPQELLAPSRRPDVRT